MSDRYVPPNLYRRAFFARMATRKHRHGADFRQVFIDCGGQCLKCGAVDNLEYHEPFGEYKSGWMMFQKRILFCRNCHNHEHPEHNSRESEFIKPSTLSFDIALEMYICGGYDAWVKKFGLVDRFGIAVAQLADPLGPAWVERYGRELEGYAFVSHIEEMIGETEEEIPIYD